MRLPGRAQKGKEASPKGEKPSKEAAGPSVIFPGPDGWELWSGLPNLPVCSGSSDQPRKLRPGVGSVMSLPSRCFFSLPLWVPLVEDSPAREQTQIKLEMKGVLGANPETSVWNFQAIRKEQLPPQGDAEPIQRQLEATAVLAAPFHEEWVVEEATRYEPAGRMLAVPGTGTFGSLRRELGRWVADFYEGGKWLHTQPLLASSLGASAAVELAATLAQLEGEGILLRLEGWLVREPGTVVPDDFRRGLDAPVRIEERIPPRPPTEVWNLPPPALTELREQKTRDAQKQKWIRTGMLVYLAVGFVLVAFLAWPLVRLKLIRSELKKIGPEAESIRTTAVLWREAGAWLDPRRNALELLWQVSRPLIESDPPKVEGVKLTLFDLNAKRLLLQGEGKDLERVEKYLQWLKNEPALAGFNWKHPQPRLLPIGTAQFQAEGILPGVSPGEEEGGENANADTP